MAYDVSRNVTDLERAIAFYEVLCRSFATTKRR
jgi:hypothetical protein